MIREGNEIVFGRKNCMCSWGENNDTKGKECGYLPCPKCKGTGRTKGGTGKGDCRASGCYRGKVHSWKPEHLQTCRKCNGAWENSEQEDYTDYMPKDIWEGLEFRVIRHNRQLSGNEQLLGMGCVFSCSDYGRSKGKTDEEMIAEVKASSSHQACKVCKEDGELCQYVGIFMANGGYSVRAVFDEKLTIATIALETGLQEYLVKGARIASEGGNGTIEALYNV